MFPRNASIMRPRERTDEYTNRQQILKTVRYRPYVTQHIISLHTLYGYSANIKEYVIHFSIGLKYDDFESPLKTEYVPIKSDSAVFFIQVGHAPPVSLSGIKDP